MFHEGDLQSGIALAVQTQKAVFCFIHDDSGTSSDWERILSDEDISSRLRSQTVALKLKAGSQEAGYLSPICPVNSVPAIVVIKNAALQANLQSDETQLEELKNRLIGLFRPSEVSRAVSTGDDVESLTAAQHQSTDVQNPETVSDTPTGSHLGYLDLQPSSGRFRLPNNAYDALRAHTQTLLDKKDSPEQILNSQLSLLERLPIFREEVKAIRSQNSGSAVLSDSARERLLRLPAAAIKAQSAPSTSDSSNQSNPGGQSVYGNRSDAPAVTERSTQPHDPPPPPIPNQDTEQTDPPTYSASQHHAQRDDYVQMQKQREQSQHDERERIKAQIKADREERRRKEDVRKQNEAAVESTSGTSTTSKPKSNEIRIQVRTFDGPTLRTTFPPTATITSDVRPWIDYSTELTVPYNLKLILTPLPNRSIEASEEELSLTDVGIKGSGTLVMVPVKGYVESYTGNTPTGLVGSAVSGGYSLVTGTVGAVFGGVKNLWYGAMPQQQARPEQDPTPSETPQSARQRNVRVRTLADQRLEETGRDQQFYNGNTLNFQPNREDDEARKKD